MLRAIKNFFGREQKSAPNLTFDELASIVGAGPTAAGVSVTPETALRSTTVLACCKVIAESVAQLPVHLYRRDGDARERVTDHPLSAVLGDAANEWTTASDFRGEMQLDLLKRGEAFAFINRVAGEVVELIRLPNSAVSVEQEAATAAPAYRVTLADGTSRRYDGSQIFHLRALGGLSPIQQAREAIGLDLALAEHAARLLGSGARPSGVLEYGGTLNDAIVKRLRGSFESMYRGSENAGKTLILEDGMKFKQLEFSSVDMQFLELRRHQVAEIARAFRVPLHMVNELERTTHANAESLGRQFLSLCLLPWLEIWEQAIKLQLLGPEERGTYYAEFVTDSLARADLAQRFAAYSQAVTNGIMSPNEVRALENRAPYEGGDEFRRPSNTEVPGVTDAAA